MDTMIISYAQYQQGVGDTQNVSIKATIDGETWSVPLDPANRHYAEIMRQVEAGELTIQDADD
jgi:hypothetical protein